MQPKEASSSPGAGVAGRAGVAGTAGGVPKLPQLPKEPVQPSLSKEASISARYIADIKSKAVADKAAAVEAAASAPIVQASQAAQDTRNAEAKVATQAQQAQVARQQYAAQAKLGHNNPVPSSKPQNTQIYPQQKTGYQTTSAPASVPDIYTQSQSSFQQMQGQSREALPSPRPQKRSRFGLAFALTVVVVAAPIAIRQALEAYDDYSHDRSIEQLAEDLDAQGSGGVVLADDGDASDGDGAISPDAPLTEGDVLSTEPTIENPQVVLENNAVKVTIDMGSGQTVDGAYFVDVELENKTSRDISLWLWDLTADNLDAGQDGYAAITAYWDFSNPDFSGDFLANTTSRGYIYLRDHLSGGPLLNVKASVDIYETENYSSIRTLNISIPEL